MAAVHISEGDFSGIQGPSLDIYRRRIVLSLRTEQDSTRLPVCDEHLISPHLTHAATQRCRTTPNSTTGEEYEGIILHSAGVHEGHDIHAGMIDDGRCERHFLFSRIRFGRSSGYWAMSIESQDLESQDYLSLQAAIGVWNAEEMCVEGR